MTGTSQRLSLLTALGQLSHSAVSGTSCLQDLAGTAVNLIIAMLQTEREQRYFVLRLLGFIRCSEHNSIQCS